MSKTKTASTINTENKVYKSRKISYDFLHFINSPLQVNTIINQLGIYSFSYALTFLFLIPKGNDIEISLFFTGQPPLMIFIFVICLQGSAIFRGSMKITKQFNNA